MTAAVLETLVRLQGNATTPVANLVLAGLTFAHSATSFLAPYEVPSGGDWAIHRSGAVVLDGVENVTVANCTWDQPGGNGLLLSNFARNNTVVGNTFAFIGDSAIVLLGRAQRETDPQDHTDGVFPAGNRIAYNHIHDYGVFGKQTACYFQSKSCANTIEFNLCYNGPRDSITFDDGFAGYNTLRGNLVFGAMRETNDGGPINMWDRTPFITPEHCFWGEPSVEKHTDIMDRNLILLGPYNAANYGLDFDDGSRNITVTQNVVYGGGHKNYVGQGKRCGPGNLFLFPELSDRIASFDPFQGCMASYGTPPVGEVFAGNDCVVHEAGYFFSFNDSNRHPAPNEQCNPNRLNETIAFLANNTYFSPTADFTVNCQGHRLTLPMLQAKGYELGSTVSTTPSVQDLMRMARSRLVMQP